MKSLTEYIQESDESRNIGSQVIKHTINDAIGIMHKLGFEFDEDYDNWTAGESIKLRFLKDNITAYLEADDKRGIYHGDNKDDVFNKLKIIDVQLSRK